jgi:hypothetical protein
MRFLVEFMMPDPQNPGTLRSRLVIPASQENIEEDEDEYPDWGKEILRFRERELARERRERGLPDQEDKDEEEEQSPRKHPIRREKNQRGVEKEENFESDDDWDDEDDKDENPRKRPVRKRKPRDEDESDENEEDDDECDDDSDEDTDEESDEDDDRRNVYNCIQRNLSSRDTGRRRR